MDISSFQPVSAHTRMPEFQQSHVELARVKLKQMPTALRIYAQS